MALDHTVVSREVARNGGRSAYRVIPAQRRADEQRARPKPRLLEENTALHDAVNSGLAQKWSPKQISTRLRQDFPDDDTMRVAPETIYQCLYLQARGELRTQLKLALRQGRTRRVSRSRTAVARGKIRDMVNISERPVEAEDRAVPGFWEGDGCRVRCSGCSAPRTSTRLSSRRPYSPKLDRLGKRHEFRSFSLCGCRGW
ncbi:MAG: IS30 family transposase [Pseudonocardiaceae bacterium]